jgi:ATP-dependent Clp protease ATP-binding subunit ClpC
MIDLELVKLFDRISQLGYSATMTDKAKDFIVDKGYDEKFGARPLKRAIQKYIEDPLAEEIIKANLQHGDSIQIDIDDSNLALKISIEKGTTKPAKK